MVTRCEASDQHLPSKGRVGVTPCQEVWGRVGGYAVSGESRSYTVAQLSWGYTMPGRTGATFSKKTDAGCSVVQPPLKLLKINYY